MPPRLTPREGQIIRLLLRGCSNAEIAKELNMAHRTVKAYFNRLFTKYGLSDFQGIKRVRLAVMLYQQELAGQPLNVIDESKDYSGET